MKRATAILFLFVLLFNLYGYRLVIDYLQHRHDDGLVAKLDKADYADEDLISIKTALSLPYYTASMDFERIDGSIEIDGVAYNYVKRRIVADSLELLCLPNAAHQKLQTAQSDFFKLSNDLQQPQGTKKPATIVKTALPDYCDAPIAFSLQALFVARPKFLQTNTPFTASRFATTPEQPPETMHNIA